MNDSSFKLLESSISHWQSRLSLLYAKTKLFCPTHQELQEVTDFQALSKLAVLQCGCERPLIDQQ